MRTLTVWLLRCLRVLMMPFQAMTSLTHLFALRRAGDPQPRRGARPAAGELEAAALQPLVEGRV
jgi:hypothetical protein